MMTIHKTPNPNPNRWSLNPPHPMLFNANQGEDSTYREALIPKHQLFSIENGGFVNRVEDIYSYKSACEIFSKIVLLENSFAIESERTSYYRPFATVGHVTDSF